MGQDRCKELRKGWRAGLPLCASGSDYVCVGIFLLLKVTLNTYSDKSSFFFFFSVLFHPFAHTQYPSMLSKLKFLQWCAYRKQEQDKKFCSEHPAQKMLQFMPIFGLGMQTVKA